MTSAARPTWAPARGGAGRNESNLGAISKQYSSRDLPGHTKLKYRQDLEAEINRTLQVAIRKAERTDDGRYRLPSGTSRNVVDEMNRLIQVIDGSLPPVRKMANTASIYELQPSAHGALARHLKSNRPNAIPA